MLFFMKTITRSRRLIYAMIVTTTLAFTSPPQGWAMLAPAQAPSVTGTGPLQYDRTQDLRDVQAALESKVVRQGLKDHGLSDAEIQDRLSKLSDRQIHQLAMHSRGVGSGGIVVELLLVVVLVLVIFYLVKRV